MSVIKSALGRVYGIDVIENQVSGYYLADEISGTYRGMMIAINDAHWVIFQQMTPVKLAMVLKELAANVKLSALRKHPRGPKKPRPKRKSCKNTPHVSTAKILAQRTK
jgi:TPP-dependent 2-oxoacid decarboxylase